MGAMFKHDTGPPSDGPRAHAREPQVLARSAKRTEDVPAEAGTQTRKRGPGSSPGRSDIERSLLCPPVTIKAQAFGHLHHGAARAPPAFQRHHESHQRGERDI